MNIGVKNVDSFIWKGLCDTRKIVESGLYIQIGNGDGIEVMHDPWLPRSPNLSSIIKEGLQGFVLLSNNRWWNWNMIDELFDDISFNLIIRIRSPNLSLMNNFI